MNEARVLSIQVGKPTTFSGADSLDPMNNPWTTGIFKTTFDGPIWLGKFNLDGDGQADLSVHGGQHKAVNVYPSEHYPYWKQDLHLLDMSSGAFGENFTTQNLLEEEVCIGDIFKVGEAVVQVSQPRQPCWKLSCRWKIEDLATRVQQTGKTGWYFRVLQEGFVEAGIDLILTERPFPQWTIGTANRIMHHRKTDFAAAQVLAQCPALSPRWQESLLKWVPK